MEAMSEIRTQGIFLRPPRARARRESEVHGGCRRG